MSFKYLNREKNNSLEISDLAYNSLNTRGCSSIEEAMRITDVLFGSGAYLYMNSTEIPPFSDLDVSGRDVLTVLSSGDFLLNFIYNKANSVLTFDINESQYYMAALKLLALEYFDYQKYFDFFSNPYSSSFLSNNEYQELKKKSQSGANLYAFWDVIMKKLEEDRLDLAKEFRNQGLAEDINILKIQVSLLGLGDYEKISEDMKVRILSYLDSNYEMPKSFGLLVGTEGSKEKGTYLENKKSYLKTRDRLKKSRIEFLKANLYNLKDDILSNGYFKNDDSSYFSTIYLSNIPEYIFKEDFFRIVKEELMPLLKKDGTIVYCAQATSEETVKMSDEELINVKNRVKEDNERTAFLYGEIVNIVEAFKDLRKEYQVDLASHKTYNKQNGFDDEDTYIYIKKR